MFNLDDLGFSPFFSPQFESIAEDTGLVPARVTADSGDIYELAGCRTTFGKISGRLRHNLRHGERPTTGDWVAVDDGPDHALIHHVLDRKTVLRRRVAGKGSTSQVVAANVDVFFIVTSANRDLNPRRVERYLTAVWDSGARPVIVLNKIDLVDDHTPMLQILEEVAPAVPLLAMSAILGTGAHVLRAYLERGITIAFIGSSGVGKSSLINFLLGHEALSTDGLRSDGKGRHTTTRRELFVLPEGGVLIDTPGMREFGVISDDGGLDGAFPDMAALAEACRFHDCQHNTEPHCAVRAAVERGEISPERVRSYQRLQREMAAAEARRDPVLGANTKRRWKAIHKEARSFYKDNPKRRS